MLTEELPEGLGFAALTALYEAERFHDSDFNSDAPIWLALGGNIPPSGSADRALRRGRKQRKGNCQPQL
jgi:hypothetical protein